MGSAIEDYLKTIYKLSLKHDRVMPKLVAERQGVTLAAVSKMVKRLVKQNLVRYDRSDGLQLSPPGRQVALEIIRHHRLIELYLHEALGYSWDRVDEEAERLEHVISEEFEDKIDKLLGYPTHDPHGAPIPTKDGRIENDRHPSLGSLAPGQSSVVRRVNDGDPEMLRYLAGCGLFPGEKVQVIAIEPYGGPIHLLVSGKEHFIGRELAENVFVEEFAEKA